MTFSVAPVFGADIDQALLALRQGDYRGAASKFLPLAEAGDLDAQYELGVMYGNGDGVPQSLEQALKWLRLAAKGGHAKAKDDLAFMEIANDDTAPLNKTPPNKMVENDPPGPDEPPISVPALIQIATVKSEAVAMTEWRRQQRRFPDQLGRLNPVIQSFDAGVRGTLFRVTGGPLEFEHAREVCGAIKRAGGSCLVTRQSESLPPPSD